MYKPIVHGYFLCYNEEYILPHLLRHYSKFCEKIYILDNHSIDRSEEIINEFSNTEIIKWNSNDEVRDDLYLQLKNNIWKNSKNQCDFVIVGDADEFLYHENMVEFLINSKKEGYTIFRPEGYHMIGDEDLVLEKNDDLFQKVTEGIKGTSNDKLMLFDPNKITEINYLFGCHLADPVGEIKYYENSDLKMLHFKYLGLNDFIPKQRTRGERLSEFNKKYSLGMYYLYSAEKHTEEYKTFIKARKKVI